MNKKKKTILSILLGVIILLLIILLVRGCTLKKYIVTFDTDGGSLIDPVTVIRKNKVSKPDDPTKDGYTFDGWYLSDDLFDFDTPIIKNITLLAHWKALNIVLKEEKINLAVGMKKEIEITSLPEGVNKEDLIWTSSNEEIAVVDENGYVLALKEGEVIITVETKDKKFKATCKVTVTKEVVDVESISIQGSDSIFVGETIKLSTVVTPENATISNLTWSISDASIASISEYGYVKGLKAGTVTITVTTNNGKTGTFTLTVKEKAVQQSNSENQNKPSNKPSKTTPETNNGGTTEKPSNPETPSEPQKPSNPEVPSEPQKPTTIPVTSVSINGAKDIYVGDTLTLSAIVSPSNATNKEVTWSVNDTSILSINNGVIKGLKLGTATVTVTTKDGGKTSTVTIHVLQKEDVYKIILTENTMAVGSSLQYKISVLKNDQVFNDYIAFILNGVMYKKGNSNSTVAKSDIKPSGNSGSIYLADGTEKNATIIIN